MSADPLAGIDLSVVTITINDCRKAGYCVAGVRRWWPAQSLPIGFNEFLRTGLAADVMLTGGDHHARLTVEKKIEREGIVAHG